jgi:hypothetical protein
MKERKLTHTKYKTRQIHNYHLEIVIIILILIIQFIYLRAELNSQWQSSSFFILTSWEFRSSQMIGVRDSIRREIVINSEITRRVSILSCPEI